MFELITLPYKREELEPYMSRETLDYHHGKHLQAYVTFVNDFVAKEESLKDKSLRDIVILSSKKSEWQSLFNNAGQVYNHNVFFSSMKKNENGSPSGKILDMINSSFGSFEKFKEGFVNAGKTLFGSGWVWLVLNGEKLEIKKYANASNPHVDDLKGLFCCDVWEHTYYIDYRNKRPDFLNAYINNLVNWDYVEEQLDGCSSC